MILSLFAVASLSILSGLTPLAQENLQTELARALFEQTWRFLSKSGDLHHSKSATVHFCEHLGFKKRNCYSKSATVHLQSLRKSGNLEIISQKSSCELRRKVPWTWNTKISENEKISRFEQKSLCKSGCKFLVRAGLDSLPPI